MPTNPAVSPVAFLIGPTGKITTWNPACQNILGYAEKDILTRQITTLLPPSMRKVFQDRLRASRGNAGKLDAHILMADGSSSPFNLTLVPQFRKSGKFSSFSVIIGPVVDNNVSFEPESERDWIRNAPLKDMIDFLAGTFYVINQAGNIVLWNRKVELATQKSATDLKDISALDLFCADEQNKIAETIREVFEHDGEVLVEANLLSTSGTSTPYLFSGSRFESHERFFLCGMGFDISARRKQEERLRLRERALHATSNGIIITRCAGKKNPIEYVNPAFESITGYLESEVLGRDPSFMAARGLDGAERGQLKVAINERRELNVVLRNMRKNGEVFWSDLKITPVRNEQDVVTHFIGVINDVTASKVRTSHLEHAMNHDVLTGLANRNLLWDRLEHALHVARRNKTMVATVLVDLDNFKTINDTLGHDAGDAVLRVIAHRLKASVRDSDTVARLGGDEFVLVLYNQPTLRFTLRMIDRLRADMAKTVFIQGKEIIVESSMGVSIFPHDGACVSDLVQAADVAMYHAKAAGRNAVHFFSEELESTTENKKKLEMTMRDAIENEQMFLVFQPKMCVLANKFIGAEALLRWRHPEKGTLLPSSFLPEAQENGLMVELGEWVFAHLCSNLERLKGIGFQNFVVSMNVSFPEFSHKNYVASIEEKLKQSNLPPEMFELEFKEADLMRDLQLSRKILYEISRLGINLTIDEFGAGISSLSDLQKFNVNCLKISRTYIENINKNNSGGIMAKTMIDIGHNMNINVIGEGVETINQLNFLTANGCDQIQGNYFCKPLLMNNLEQFLLDGNSRNLNP